MGDLDGDGDLDIVLAKGRHDPLIDRVLLNNGKGRFVAKNLGPDADRTYTAALTDADGDGDLDVLTSNDTPDRKLVFLNDGKGRFTVAGTWGVATWSTRNAAVADMNGDGRADVIAGESSWSELRLLESRRRQVRHRLHQHPGEVSDHNRAGRLRWRRRHRPGRTRQGWRPESDLLQRRQGRLRAHHNVRPTRQQWPRRRRGRLRRQRHDGPDGRRRDRIDHDDLH